MERRQGRRALAATLAAGLALSAACGGDRQTGQVVAKVGERPITDEDLRTFVLTLPPGLRSPQQGQEARRDYLQTLIDRELMLQEARARGLDRDEELRRAQRRKVEDRVLALYGKRQVQPQATVSQAEVDAYVADSGLGRERLAEAVAVHTEAEARQVLEEVANGRPFGEVAQERSLDRATGSRGGAVGYLNRAVAERAGIPAEVFDTLQIGEPSPPLPQGDGWQVVRFIDERAGAAEAVQAGVRVRLAREARAEVEDQQAERLAHELGWRLDEAGLAVLAAAASGRTLQLSPAQRQTPLFAFDGGKVTAADYLDALRENRVRTARALTDSAFVASAGERFLRNRTMLLVAAAREGIPEEPEVARWADRVLVDLVLQALRRQIVAAAETMATEAGVRQYYDEHATSFRVPGQICYDEILFPSREQAERVRAEIDDGTDLLGLARLRGYPVRRRQADGLVCLRDLSRAAIPDFWKALEEAPAGRIAGPLPLKDQAFALVKVMRKEPERLQGFDEARQRARASLVNRLERQLFDSWVEAARQRHEADVRVFDERLEAALPDALLGGAGAGAGADAGA